MEAPPFQLTLSRDLVMSSLLMSSGVFKNRGFFNPLPVIKNNRNWTDEAVWPLRNTIEKVKYSTHSELTCHLELATSTFFLLSQEFEAPSTLMHFRLKTHTFQCVFAYRPYDNDRKRKNAYCENAVQSGDIWKQSPIVLVWTAKTEAFENADVIHIAGASICRIPSDCCSVFKRIRAF